MTPDTSQEFESYVPVYDAIPDKWEDAQPFLVEHLKKISNAVNIREIGWLLDEELLSGKAFIPSAINNTGEMQQFRSVLRKVIDFGSLPNNNSKTVAHGIVVDDNFTLIDLWGAATDPNGLISIPLPFVGEVVNTSIALLMDSSNVIVRTHDVKSNFSRCFIFIEYIQEI